MGACGWVRVGRRTFCIRWVAWKKEIDCGRREGVVVHLDETLYVYLSK